MRQGSRFYQRPSFYFLLFGLFLGIFVLSEIFPFRLEKFSTGPRINPHALGPRYEYSSGFPLAAKDPHRAESVQLGAEIFYQTAKFAPKYVGNGLACTSCHFQGGTQLGMLGLVGVARKYPEFESRSGHEVTLPERLQSCFVRSLNGKAPSEDSAVLRNLLDYVEYLSEGVSKEQSMEWRDLDWIPASERIPIAQLDPRVGRELFDKNCSACHGKTGKGDAWAPPLWGDRSYNDGAGLARVYTLAGFLYRAMPLSAPNSLTIPEAQQVAAYIDAMPRPAYSEKSLDYPKGDIPIDAVYYPRKYPENPLTLRLSEENVPSGQP